MSPRFSRRGYPLIGNIIALYSGPGFLIWCTLTAYPWDRHLYGARRCGRIGGVSTGHFPYWFAFRAFRRRCHRRSGMRSEKDSTGSLREDPDLRFGKTIPIPATWIHSADFRFPRRWHADKKRHGRRRRSRNFREEIARLENSLCIITFSHAENTRSRHGSLRRRRKHEASSSRVCINFRSRDQANIYTIPARELRPFDNEGFFSFFFFSKPRSRPIGFFSLIQMAARTKSFLTSRENEQR